MKVVAAAVMSTLVAALMVCMPVSAGGNTVSFVDGEHDFYKMAIKNNSWGDNNPIFQADYLDAKAGSVTIKGNAVTLSITMYGLIPEKGSLPQGVKWVVWGWLFFDPSFYNAQYLMYCAGVGWDGNEFTAFIWGNVGPWVVILDEDNFEVNGYTVTMFLSRSDIEGSSLFFYESYATWSGLEPNPYIHMPYGGGWHVDEAPDAAWMPQLPLP